MDEALSSQVEKLGVDFATLSRDPAPSLGIARPKVLPTTLVINPQGVLVETLLGPQTEASLLGAIDSAEEQAKK